MIKMTTWFERLKDEVKEFFEQATDEEISVALDRANYSHYKNIDIPILAMNEINKLDKHFVFKSFVNLNLEFRSSSINFESKKFNLDEFCIAEDDYYEYNAAA